MHCKTFLDTRHIWKCSFYYIKSLVSDLFCTYLCITPIWPINKVFPQFIPKGRTLWMNLGLNWGKFGNLSLPIMISHQDVTPYQISSKSGEILPRWTFYNLLKLKLSSVHCGEKCQIFQDKNVQTKE